MAHVRATARWVSLAVATVASSTLACSRDDASPAAPSDAAMEAASEVATDEAGTIIGTEWFDDVSESAGLSFAHALDKTLNGRFQGGVCVLDVDGDGALDLLFPSFVEDGASTTHLMMSRGGAGALAYVDETAARGLADTGFAQGCVAFDVDGDGDDDVLAVGLGTAKLFRNDGGNFVNASDRLPAMFPADEMFTAAVAFDADGDGDLDLAIASYGTHVKPTTRTCVVDCKLEPETYLGGTTRLLLQKDDGAFEDASARLGKWDEPGLVLLATDLDGDGKIDLFVGNDVSTFLDRYFKGDGVGGFTEVGKALGVAHSFSLKGVCSMSAVDGDIDHDGQLDMMESTYAGETNALFNCKGGVCKDIAEEVDLFRTPRNLRWGQAIADFDDDGIPELVEASGHLYVDEDFPAGATKPIGVGLVEVPPLLWFRVDVGMAYQLQTPERGLGAKTGGRGLVATDLDGDGALDVVIGAGRGHPLLLRNIRGGRGHRLTVRLKGKGKNTRGIGARVTVTAPGATSAAMIHAGDSYHSSGPALAHFGLGAATQGKVVVRWPSGKTSEVAAAPADQIVVVDEP